MAKFVRTAGKLEREREIRVLINPEKSWSIGSLRGIASLAAGKTFLPPLNLITVAALLPPEWKLRLVDLDARKRMPPLLRLL